MEPMASLNLSLLPELADTVRRVVGMPVSAERQIILEEVISYIQGCLVKQRPVNLQFICTHNSRRSQFSQVWAQTAADCFGVEAHCFSGGTEVTAFDHRVAESLSRSGFRVDRGDGINPVYSIQYSKERPPVLAHSKRFADQVPAGEGFAAVMTCDHADDHCPVIPGAEQRIPLWYDDPKLYDGSTQESEQYDKRSMQIASEMFYVFAKVKRKR